MFNLNNPNEKILIGQSKDIMRNDDIQGANVSSNIRNQQREKNYVENYLMQNRSPGNVSVNLRNPMFADYEYQKQQVLQINQDQALQKLSSDLKMNDYNFNPSDPTNGHRSRIDIDNFNVSKSVNNNSQMYNDSYMMKQKVKQMNDQYEHDRYNQHLQQQQQQQMMSQQNNHAYMSYGAMQNKIQRSVDKNEQMSRIGNNHSQVMKRSQIQNNSNQQLNHSQLQQQTQQSYQQQQPYQQSYQQQQPYQQSYQQQHQYQQSYQQQQPQQQSNSYQQQQPQNLTYKQTQPSAQEKNLHQFFGSEPDKVAIRENTLQQNENNFWTEDQLQGNPNALNVLDDPKQDVYSQSELAKNKSGIIRKQPKQQQSQQTQQSQKDANNDHFWGHDDDQQSQQKNKNFYANTKKFFEDEKEYLYVDKNGLIKGQRLKDTAQQIQGYGVFNPITGGKTYNYKPKYGVKILSENMYEVNDSLKEKFQRNPVRNPGNYTTTAQEVGRYQKDQHFAK